MSVRAAVVSWRARRIDDPIKRLAYLRASMGVRPAVVGHRPARLAFLLVPALFLLPAGVPVEPRVQQHRSAPQSGPAAKTAIWRVESDGAFELYSNGLRVDVRRERRTNPRRYQVAWRNREDDGVLIERESPAGILFHTTENQQAPMVEAANPRLNYLSRSLLETVEQHRSYHYLVDRFGRVFRLVRESDEAFHAGRSIWADQQWTYLDLNNAFLAVAIEAQSDPEAETAAATAAQITALKQLIEMLRGRYGIAAENCVTHAQASVNPGKRRIGWHTDWAAHFPYLEAGLPDNYEAATPAVVLFGFRYDSELVKATGPAYWRGVLLAEQEVKARAAAQGVSPAQYREALYQRYLRATAKIQKESQNEAPHS